MGEFVELDAWIVFVGARELAVGTAGGGRAVGRVKGVGAVEDVVDGADAGRAGFEQQEATVGGTVVDEGVVDQVELVLVPFVAFDAERDEVSVDGVGALLDDVADDVGDAAAGQVEFIAGAAGFVGEAVVEDMAFAGARFDQLAAIGMVRVGARQAEALDAADVNVVGLPGTETIAGEFAVFDVEFAAFVVVGEDAVLVVEEGAVAQDEVAFFKADAGAVTMFHLGPGKLDVLNGDPATTDDPDAFAFDVAAVGCQSSLAADGADGELVLGPDGDVARVVAGFDFHSVAVACVFRGGGNAGVGLEATDAQGAWGGCWRSAVTFGGWGLRGDGEGAVWATANFAKVAGRFWQAGRSSLGGAHEIDCQAGQYGQAGDSGIAGGHLPGHGHGGARIRKTALHSLSSCR